MTNAERIIAYLAEQGIDLLRFPWTIVKDKWQRPGTIVVNEHYLTKEEQRKLFNLPHWKGCQIELHSIRVNFEWQDGYSRISWKGERTTASKHYYIKRTNLQTGRVDYKRYKCIDGFTTDKSVCWQFSRTGAKGIIQVKEKDDARRKDRPYYIPYKYELEEVK